LVMNLIMELRPGKARQQQKRFGSGRVSL
jgi:hypothetical protein